jgi:hypothetical protein
MVLNHGQSDISVEQDGGCFKYDNLHMSERNMDKPTSLASSQPSA